MAPKESKKKWKFIKNNIYDLIAILPLTLSQVFRVTNVEF